MYAAGPERDSEGSLLALTVAAILALAALRVAGLAVSETDLFFDEAQYWYWGQDFAFGYFSKPPMIGWVIGATTALCGDSEFCVRLPAPLFHTATALILLAAGRVLYEVRTACLAALAYATLPGVSLGSALISTDTVLLTFWVAALWLFVSQERAPRGWKPVALGVAIGLGLLSKYAMIYFPIGLIVAAIATPRWRRALLRREMALAALVALGVFAPNLWWNLAESGGATLRHTADNANWDGKLLNPEAFLMFLVGQFGVFGPVLFAALLLAMWQGARGRLFFTEADRLLLSLSLPILLLVATQAFISRAHANWAATAYVAASLLIVALLVRQARGWLKASFALNGIAAAAIIAGGAVADSFDPRIGRSPYYRTLGWSEAVAGVGMHLAEARARGEPYAVAVGAGRKVTAELFYYLREEPTPLRAWAFAPEPGDHYQMVAAYDGTPEGRALLITRDPDPAPFDGRFETILAAGKVRVPASPSRERVFYLFTATGYHR